MKSYATGMKFVHLQQQKKMLFVYLEKILSYFSLRRASPVRKFLRFQLAFICKLEARNLKYEVTNSLACPVINLLRLLTFVSMSIQSIAICIETSGIHVYKLKYSQTYVTPSV